MKALILLLLCISIYPASNAQKIDLEDSIQVYYHTGKMGGAIGGQDHSVKIWKKEGVIFCQRKCYGLFNNNKKDDNSILNSIDTTLTQELYQMTQEKAILQFYQENSNFIILDEYVKIDQSQFDKFTKIIDEIIAFGTENDIKVSNELIVSTKRNHYLIKKNNKIFIIIDWFGCYDKSKDIEKCLGLKSYSRCPCIINDLSKAPSRNH